MNDFSFKISDNRFIWESDFMALEFSSPSIQGFSEYVHLQDENEIMYYYYTVKVFKKISTYDDNNNEIITQELVCERTTHDFPTILQLKWIIEQQLNDNTYANCQKIEYVNGDVKYLKVMNTEGFACDDFYEITKNFNIEDNDIHYTVYTGTTFDGESDLNSVGIRTPYVFKSDLEQLLECVSSFVKYSINENNKWIDKLKTMVSIRGQKLYRYPLSENGLKVNVIEEMYAIGDNIDITTVVDNKETSYTGTIINICNEAVILDNEIKIEPSSVVFASNKPTEEMLRYNESEIVQDFVKILSKEEENDFVKLTTEECMGKYKSAIIGRTWMCRDEHNFNIDYNKRDDRVKVVTPIVQDVIRLIKQHLTSKS